ncbi:LysR family transcriptional regulator [Granulicella sp. S190]|uniref:LysR substrate-binding domain-containing protein n=1 Tax=Granulicella sp. S190 TaxID=1747226 RepID=UPI00131D4357|nr:LysR family transcriptional regulator [Granulicella sp. S190]
MELRHLRYFAAVVQWKGYREASRHLYITQPSISQAVSDLESELGIKLFLREGKVARLTPEGEAFYEEAIKTLAQAARSIATAQRAAKGEFGRLGIGFMGFSSSPFLPELLRKYKARHPGVSLRLVEDVPHGQDIAFDRGEIDIAFTRPPSPDRSSSYQSQLLFKEPLVVALPKSRDVTTKRVRIADLAGERFVVFQRTSSPEVFDTIVRVCNDNGFSPRLHHELNNMNSVLATVEAGEGVAIVPATASNLRPENISFHRLQPDEVRIDFVAAWQKKQLSVALRSFLELLEEESPSIRAIMKFT